MKEIPANTVLQTVVKSAVTKSTSRDFKEKMNNKDRYKYWLIDEKNSHFIPSVKTPLSFRHFCQEG